MTQALGARRFLPELISLVWDRTINLGKVFDLTLPLAQVGKGPRSKVIVCGSKEVTPDAEQVLDRAVDRRDPLQMAP